MQGRIIQSIVNTVEGDRKRNCSPASVDPEALLEPFPDVPRDHRMNICAEGIAVRQPDLIQEEDHCAPTYFGPRIILVIVASLYGTNFPLGAIMDDNMPASVAVSSRMVLASVALSPFLFSLERTLIIQVIMCGCFSSLGYISQSLALIDTSPERVSFLGATTVIVCPSLEYFVDGKSMRPSEAPQTWLSVVTCLTGVAVLEFCHFGNGNPFSSFGFGDVLGILQALGFGASVFLKGKIMLHSPEQALPITSVLLVTTAFLSILWCLIDGCIGQTGFKEFALSEPFFAPSSLKMVALVLWTGIVSTALNQYMETVGLGHVQPGEAAVFLATEPLWAAFFSVLLLDESHDVYDYLGGFLIVIACMLTSLKPSHFHSFISSERKEVQRD